jgi:hypothetical protein
MFGFKSEQKKCVSKNLKTGWMTEKAKEKC